MMKKYIVLLACTMPVISQAMQEQKATTIPQKEQKFVAIPRRASHEDISDLASLLGESEESVQKFALSPSKKMSPQEAAAIMALSCVDSTILGHERGCSKTTTSTTKTAGTSATCLVEDYVLNIPTAATTTSLPAEAQKKKGKDAEDQLMFDLEPVAPQSQPVVSQPQ